MRPSSQHDSVQGSLATLHPSVSDILWLAFRLFGVEIDELTRECRRVSNISVVLLNS